MMDWQWVNRNFWWVLSSLLAADWFLFGKRINYALELLMFDIVLFITGNSVANWHKFAGWIMVGLVIGFALNRLADAERRRTETACDKI